MKNRLGVISLIVICLGLLIALIVIRNQATEKQRQDAEAIGTFSNNWVKTSSDLDAKLQEAASLKKDLEGQQRAILDLTNNFSQVSANLSQVSANLTKTEASLKAAQEEMAKRDAKIAELTTQNQVLDKQAVDLSSAITNLTTQIAETQRKLSASEGDKAFLEKELKRLMAEKAELERQFNDLAIMRAQVAKLKEELSIARRLDWIRRGLFASADEKGAQKLVAGVVPVHGPATAPKPNYNLNVEVSADGTARVVPPTNSPPATNAPAK